MNRNKVILVAGGDLRQIYLAKELARSNKVYIFGFDKNMIHGEDLVYVDSLISLSERADYVVLPLPASSDGVMVHTPLYKHSVSLENLISVMKEDSIVFGGKVSKMTRKVFQSRSISVIDYLEREEMSVMNAVPTAEGAVQIAMEELPTTIFGQKVLVTGFGRISKVLVKILNGLSTRTDVAARRYSDLAWAEIYGCNVKNIYELENYVSEYDLIFNTVPAKIFDDNVLLKLKKDCIIIDLASKPGGVNLDKAIDLGIKTIWALSLPGKVAPVTSGEIIAKTIMNILEERGEI